MRTPRPLDDPGTGDYWNYDPSIAPGPRRRSTRNKDVGGRRRTAASPPLPPSPQLSESTAYSPENSRFSSGLPNASGVERAPSSFRAKDLHFPPPNTPAPLSYGEPGASSALGLSSHPSSLSRLDPSARPTSREHLDEARDAILRHILEESRSGGTIPSSMPSLPAMQRQPSRVDAPDGGVHYRYVVEEPQAGGTRPASRSSAPGTGRQPSRVNSIEGGVIPHRGRISLREKEADRLLHLQRHAQSNAASVIPSNSSHTPAPTHVPPPVPSTALSVGDPQRNAPKSRSRIVPYETYSKVYKRYIPDQIDPPGCNPGKNPLNQYRVAGTNMAYDYSSAPEAPPIDLSRAVGPNATMQEVQVNTLNSEPRPRTAENHMPGKIIAEEHPSMQTPMLPSLSPKPTPKPIELDVPTPRAHTPVDLTNIDEDSEECSDDEVQIITPEDEEAQRIAKKFHEGPAQSQSNDALFQHTLIYPAIRERDPSVELVEPPAAGDPQHIPLSEREQL